MARRPTSSDLVPTDEELAAARTAANAPGAGAAWGGGIGTALGAIGGGLLGTILVPGLGTAAGATLGAGVGGGLGSALGGTIGGEMGKNAGNVLTADQAKRQKLLDEDALRQEALQALMATK